MRRALRTFSSGVALLRLANSMASRTISLDFQPGYTL